MSALLKLKLVIIALGFLFIYFTAAVLPELGFDDAYYCANVVGANC